MKIGSIKENLKIEQRIAVTPEIIKKYKSLNLNIILPKGYGEHLGISDDEFINQGAEIVNDKEKILSEADVVLQMNLIGDENFEKLQNEQILIGVLNPYSNKEKISKLIHDKLPLFTVEQLKINKIEKKIHHKINSSGLVRISDS